MAEINITITGRIPSKKNSRITVRKTGRSFPSKAHEAWYKDATVQLMKQRAPRKNLERVRVSIYIYFPDRRVADLTNKTESIMDLLVGYGVLKDDSWQVARPLVLDGGYDKENPRAEIIITDLGE